MNKKQTIKKYILLLLSLSSTICFGQVQTYHVKPIQTDINYSPIEDSSTISINTDNQLNKLFLFIGGTNSSSSIAYVGLRVHAVGLGFDFINLSYPNNIAAFSLTNNNDSLAFNKYRQEICFGTPISNDVTVDSLNSIFTRTLKLLQYLDLTYPSENWGQYLTTPNSINWSKIIIGGHSQGAGHAAYIAKQFSVDRVLMFSGPNDYSNHFSNSANWLRQPGVTPATKHFAYLSLNDEVVDFSKQFINLSGLGMHTYSDTTHVDLLSSPYENSHLLYTTQSPGIMLNHSVPVRFTSINRNVWTYMLTSTITTSLNDYTNDFNFSIFPNPTSSILHLKSTNVLTGKIYTLRNLAGQVIMSKRIAALNQVSIDISRMVSGVYFLSIDDYTFKVVKQ